jgi:hypothetical protein
MSSKATPVSQLVRTEFAPRLEQLGFELRIPRRGVWLLVRTIESRFEQFVTLYTDTHVPGSLRCEYGTTDVPHLGSAESLVKRKLPQGWQYADEDSLKAVLAELLEITLAFGLPQIERNGGPLPRPTEEDARRLLDGPEAWATAFAERFGISMGKAEDLSRAEALVIEHKQQSVEPDWDLLLGAAAYLGELIRSAIGGTWVWEDYRMTPSLSVRIGFVYPVIRVGEYWAKETTGYLTSYYRFFVERG